MRAVRKRSSTGQPALVRLAHSTHVCIQDVDMSPAPPPRCPGFALIRARMCHVYVSTPDPVSLLSTDMKIGVAYLVREPRLGLQ